MTTTQKNTAQVYNTHFGELKKSLLLLERRESIVEDVLQDAFIRFYLNSSKGKTIHNPKAWLFRVSKNLLIDLYRSETKRSQNHTTEHNDKRNTHGPEDCLMGIIANLPNKYKKAVYLTDVKGISQTESAKNLNISLPTFKSHVQRGRKLVAKGYVDCCDYTLDESGHLQGESKDWSECKVCSKSI